MGVDPAEPPRAFGPLAKWLAPPAAEGRHLEEGRLESGWQLEGAALCSRLDGRKRRRRRLT
jgi:hypothetical protein